MFPLFQMYFEGYVKILGIEVGAYLNITMQQMEIYIYGKVWDLIYCEVYVAAAYDYMTITDAHFYIRVIVDLRGLTDVSWFGFLSWWRLIVNWKIELAMKVFGILLFEWSNHQGVLFWKKRNGNLKTFAFWSCYKHKDK